MTNFDPYDVDIEKCHIVLDVQEFGDQVAVQVVHVDDRFKKEKPQSTHPKPVDSFNSIVDGEVFALMSDELSRWIEALRAWSVNWEGFKDDEPYIVPLSDDREPQVGDVYYQGQNMLVTACEDRDPYHTIHRRVFALGRAGKKVFCTTNRLSKDSILKSINGCWQNGAISYDPLPELGYMEQTQPNGLKRIFIG